MGGQKTLRSYWKNYFEKTDTLIWVVDATDRLRIDDCREELAGLLLEEVDLLHLCFSKENYLTNIIKLFSAWWELVFWSFWIKPTLRGAWQKTKSGRYVCFPSFCLLLFPANIEWSQRLRLDAIKTHGWTILPCSAMTGRNLHEGLEWVVQDAKDRLFLY